MPPKGYKKGYVKHPKTGEWVDSRVLKNEQEEQQKELGDPGSTIRQPPKKKVKDDLGPPAKPVKDDQEFAKVIISWKDDRGRMRNTQYTMRDLEIRESITEQFAGAKKKRFIHVSLDGTVVEKI